MSIEYHFKASADKVFERLCDPDYLVDRCLALGELEAECTVDDETGGVVITMRRTVERKLPSFLAKIFDPCQSVELIEHWKTNGRQRTGSYELKVKGQPVTVRADIRLEPGARNTCTYTITHSAKANIPLIGRRIEQFILDQTESGARAELDHLARHL